MPTIGCEARVIVAPFVCTYDKHGILPRDLKEADPLKVSSSTVEIGNKRNLGGEMKAHAKGVITF